MPSRSAACSCSAGGRATSSAGAGSSSPASPCSRWRRWPPAWPPHPACSSPRGRSRAWAARSPRRPRSRWSCRPSRRAGAGTGRWPCTRPSPAAAPHSAWCSAGSSPSGSRGAGRSSSTRRPGHFDLAGALTSVTGMAALVYAFIRAASAGWSDRMTLAALALAVAGLAAFVLTETRAAQPVTPLRLFADSQRSASYAARLLLVGGMFGMFFFATQYLQLILGFSPVQAGLAFLPMTILLFSVSRLAARLLGRFAPVPLALAGMIPVIAGMAWLSRISPGTGYLPGVLGPMILFGVGMGLAMVPLTTAALAGVRPEDSGAASSMVNVTQQVGGALGLAILVTVFGAASRAPAGPASQAGGTELASAHEHLVHGMASAFTVATLFDVCALLVMAGAAVATRRARRAVAAGY